VGETNVIGAFSVYKNPRAGTVLENLAPQFSSTPFGVGLYKYFPGVITPGYSKLTPSGVSNKPS
jgi:hypothetical protein